MARVSKRWNVDRTGFPSIVCKKPEDISIGFEWEIQQDEYTYYNILEDLEYNDKPIPNYLKGMEMTGCALDRYSLDFVDLYSFRIHGECEGSEFASPVFHKLATAKAMANKLRRRAGKDRFLDVNNTDNCGIHVHTGYTGWLERSRSYNSDFLKALGMLNRESSANFIREFSGRGNYHEYVHQSEATGWDCDSDFFNTSSSIDLAEDLEMVRENGFGRNKTIEYRIWSGLEDRLLPAIEFSHACTKFITSTPDNSRYNVEVPYLKDMKAWLGKQSGYKILKQRPEWAHVE